MAHISGYNDKLVKVTPLLEMTGSGWKDFLSIAIRKEERAEMRKHEQTGRPLGSESFVESLENMLGRTLKPKRAGRKPKNK